MRGFLRGKTTVPRVRGFQNAFQILVQGIARIFARENSCSPCTRVSKANFETRSRELWVFPLRKEPDPAGTGDFPFEKNRDPAGTGCFSCRKLGAPQERAFLRRKKKAIPREQFFFAVEIRAFPREHVFFTPQKWVIPREACFFRLKKGCFRALLSVNR